MVGIRRSKFALGGQQQSSGLQKDPQGYRFVGLRQTQTIVGWEPEIRIHSVSTDSERR
jgi:hypothetical protein